MRVAVLVTIIVYFAAMLTLTLTLPAIWAMSREARLTSQRAMGDTIASALARIPANDAVAYEREVERLRTAYPIVRLTSDSETSPSGRHPDSVQVRRVNNSRITIEFATDTQAENQIRRSLFASTAAAFAGLLLLGIAGFDFLRDPRFGHSHRDMSVSDRMVATLGTSVRAMKGRETEARERAAELSTITSTLVRSLTSGFIALDEEGRILDVNLAARELLSEENSVTGLDPAVAIHRPRFAEALQHAADTRAAFQRHEVTELDGTAFGLTTVPLLDDGGRYFGMLALFVDLTQVRGLEQRVREMQSLADLGEMSAGIAHEFRNSLSTVLGYLNLARKSTLPVEAEERIGRAEEEARQLNGAVASLLAFARPMELALQHVDLRSLVDEVVEQARPMAATVDIVVEGNGASVMGDPLLLKRVIENVLRNAIESIREKGDPGRVTVTVGTSPSPMITVQDNGVGVDPSRASTLFLPFQSTKPDGFGLGLALTRKIVLLHGGTVSLSGVPGAGATVEIRFAAV